MSHITQLLILVLITTINGNEIDHLECLNNNECLNDFFWINNYCCPGIPDVSFSNCCNIIKYITRNDNYWQNVNETIENPRGINIVIGASIIIIILLMISIGIQLIYCMCCGRKKYIIVEKSDNIY